jgi:hypothetical protein
LAWLSKWRFYPLLFAAFPALSYFARNVGQVEPADVVRPLALSLAVGLLVFAAMWAVLRDLGRAAVAASLATILVLSYGHLYDGLKAIGLSGTTIVRHRYLLPAVGFLILLGVVAATRIRSSRSWTGILAAVAIFALVGPILQIAGYYVPLGLWSLGDQLRTRACTLRPGSERPDIYLIILDAYEREDVLRDTRGYDNSEFLGELEDMGFYVAPGSLSNYSPTRLSIASVLNMTYVQDFPERFGTDRNLIWLSSAKIQDNVLRHELECVGYTTVAFETGVAWTEWRDADSYFHRGERPPLGLSLLRKVTRAELAFLDTTWFRPLLHAGEQGQDGAALAAADPLKDHRDRILFVFDQLQDVAELPSPKLVFVHIVSPHPPFVFGPQGENVREGELETPPGQESRYAYTDQVEYLNDRIVEVLQDILEKSGTAPVIVIMGDHGWTEKTPETRMANLNAYLLPGGDEGLYPTITPVNTFRLILDRYFGAGLGLLPDQSYISGHGSALNLTPVPNTWPTPASLPTNTP